MLDYIIFALSVLHFLLVISTTLRMLLREDISAPARLAWFSVIVALPFVGLAAYLLMGEVWFPRTLREYHDRARAMLKAAQPDIYNDQTPALIPPPYDKSFKYSKTINGFPPVNGTHLELLPDAAEVHRRMIADIDAATSSVNVIFYIWLPDTTGTEIAQALIRAAKRGVICRAAADNLGSRKLLRTQIWQNMKLAGVQVQAAMPFRAIFRVWLTARFDLRNHRKITVIDGKIAWVGSKNAADPAFLPKAKYGPWIDIMLRAQGPLVHQVQALFIEDWLLGDTSDVSAFDFNAAAQEGGCITQFRGTGPLQRRHSVSQAFCTLFELAEQEINITTPYFVPNTSVIQALQAAALRGVKVTLNLPAKNDSWIVKAASQGNYLALLEAGARIMEHGPGLLHSKIVTVDGVLTMLGSSNLDMRSFDLNFENDLLIYGIAETSMIRQRQLEYLAQSHEITMDDLNARSMLLRLRDNLVATLGPIL